MYLNGTQLTAFSASTYPALNYDGQINNTVLHTLGTSIWASQYMDGLMALPILVDGAALDPTSFGEEDDDGYWNPIEFTTADIPNGIGGTTVPLMTTNTTPSGTASGTGASADAWKPFGVAIDQSFEVGATSMFVQYQHTSAKTVTKYYLNGRYYSSGGYEGQHPKDWTLEGSNDGSAWTVVDTVTGETGWTNGLTGIREFTVDTPGSYTYYKLNVTANNGAGQTQVGFLQFMEASTGFGTNGFQLDYADTAAFGADVKTNTNTMTPTFEAQYYNTSNLTTYTFSACDLGTADADRSIIVAVGAGRVSAGSRTVSSLTIGGVSATFAGRKQTVNLNANEIWYAKVPTGATGDVVVTFNAGMLGCGIGIWSVLNLGPVQDVQGDNTSGGVASQSVSIGGGESAFAVFNVYDEANPSGLSAVSWSTATERYEDLTVEGQSSLMGADYTFSTSSNATTVTATYTGTGGNDGSLLGVTFGRPNDNFYKANNFTAADQLSDTPTDSAADGIGNYCTLNPIGGYDGSYSEGNLKFTNGSASGYTNVVNGTLYASSGKFYWESEWLTGVYFSWIGAAERHDPSVTSASALTLSSGYIGRAAAPDSWAFYVETGQKSYRGTVTSYGSASSAGAVLGVALDMDNGKIWVSVNGVWQNSGDPAAGTGEMFSGLTGEVGPAGAHWASPGGGTYRWNFGQTDFAYTPPTGFSAFATQNLPAPTIADPSAYFNTVLYTGNGTSQSITGVGFQPDLVWMKSRDFSYSHTFVDVVRGATKEIYSNATNAETTAATGLTSLDSDGFSVGADAGWNANADDKVAWCWKAGGTAVTNSIYSITSSSKCQYKSRV
jgi:hypothetical protein